MTCCQASDELQRVCHLTFCDVLIRKNVRIGLGAVVQFYGHHGHLILLCQTYGCRISTLLFIMHQIKLKRYLIELNEPLIERKQEQ